jgi:DNA-binding transcriptional MocR family regulator
MELISFAGEGLDPDLLPVQELADCAQAAIAEDGERVLSYGSGAGYTPLRELIAEELGVHPYRVILTNGWLQGFRLLAKAALTTRKALVELPGCDRALSVLFELGATVLYASPSAEGIALEALGAQFSVTRRPSLAFFMPSFQNPSGRALSLTQRSGLLGLLHRPGTVVVEDDSYGQLRLEGEPLPTLFELSGRTTVYSSSYSYLAAPGLRVAVFVVPDELVGTLTARATDLYISPSLVAQAAVFEFMRRGSMDAHLVGLRDGLRLRRDTMVEALEREVPDASWVVPAGGVFLQVRVPPGMNAQSVMGFAEGVEAYAENAHGGFPHTLRLNFGALGPAAIERGIERLGRAFAAAR